MAIVKIVSFNFRQTWLQIQTSQLTSCGTLNNPFHITNLQFLQLEGEGKSYKPY